MGAERALGRLEGVRSVEAVIGSLRVQVTPERDRTLDFAAIPPAVAEGAGLNVRRIQILADGRVEPGPRFRIDGWPDAFPLDGDLPDGPARIRAEVRVGDGGPTLRLLDG